MKLTDLPLAVQNTVLDVEAASLETLFAGTTPEGAIELAHYRLVKQNFMAHDIPLFLQDIMIACWEQGRATYGDESTNPFV